MEEDSDTIRCLALPIVGDQLLVPNAVVAEVFTVPGVSAVNDGPSWLLGSLLWRGAVLPLVSMETALGGNPMEIGDRAKLVVMHALSAAEILQYYAVLVQGIPRQVLASEQSVQPAPDLDSERTFVAAELRVEGERAFIPDLDGIEKALLLAADAWRRPIEAGQ